MIRDLDWHSFLQRWSGEAIAHQDELYLELADDARRTGWLGPAPATATQIAAAEARLGVSLPPSLREFYSIANGWPALGHEFGAIVPVDELALFRDADPDSYEIWGIDDEENHDYHLTLSRSVLLSDGSDQLLLDPGRVDGSGEWPCFGLTSWYPGIANELPSFRLGMEDQYATIVRFDVPESVTHAEVAAEVERIYRRLLAGDSRVDGDLEWYERFGDDRAAVLFAQLGALREPFRAWGKVMGSVAKMAGDAGAAVDLWPLFAASVTAPGDGDRSSMVDIALREATPEVSAAVTELVERARRDGGLRASYPGEFGAAAERARAFVRAGDDAAAWQVFLTALPLWQPASPNHLAPLAIIWDQDLRHLYTHERGEQILRTSRARHGDFPA